MLPSASALASRREERVRKAFSVDHHGPGDARLSHGARGIYGELGDTVRYIDLPSLSLSALVLSAPFTLLVLLRTHSPYSHKKS